MDFDNSVEFAEIEKNLADEYRHTTLKEYEFEDLLRKKLIEVNISRDDVQKILLTLKKDVNFLK